MAAQDTPSDIVARAQALIEQVQRQLAEADAFYRSQGLDPHKVHMVLKAQSTPQSEAQAHQAFEADMQAVEQEVQEERVRMSFSASPSTAAKRPRMMI